LLENTPPSYKNLNVYKKDINCAITSECGKMDSWSSGVGLVVVEVEDCSAVCAEQQENDG